MTNLLTAIGNPMLNRKFKELENYQVLADDIKTDEELIEWLERVEQVDILFLCSNIIQNYAVDEFITIIRKIQEDVLIFFFKGENMESSLQENDSLKIYNSLDFDLKFFEKIFQQILKKKVKKYTSKIIAISGPSGIGKSTFSTFLAQNVEKGNVKTLLIDFDIEENQIRTLLKIKKHPQKMENLKEAIINVNKNLDVICHLDFIFPNKNQIDFFKIQEMLNQFKEEYNLIIIDTSSKLENEFTKRIFYNCDEIIFLLEPNMLGVKKAQNMLEVFEKDWKISNEKIKLILNKANMYQISDEVFGELFPNIKLIGKMKYLDSYNLKINKNIDKREIQKEYEKIYKKI